MDKRNKLWRKRHQWRLFKARMILMAANRHWAWSDDGEFLQLGNGHACHPKRNFSFSYCFLETQPSFLLTYKYHTFSYEGGFQMKTKERDCKDPITAMKGSISIRAE